MKLSESRCETGSGGTLEKPVQSGAEGARHMPNLSGKRTEHLICKDIAIFFDRKSDCFSGVALIGSSFFVCWIETTEKRMDKHGKLHFPG